MDLRQLDLGSETLAPPAESLFERCHWLYAVCREYLFRDHTSQITTALFPFGNPRQGTHILEVGCGPGLYACRLAQAFPQVTTTGVDLSARLIHRARCRAQNLRLKNCTFIEGDVRKLGEVADAVDAVILSRLFLVVPEREDVLAEVFRVLRPGGRCFIAEPTSAFTTRLPLTAMWLMARLTGNPLQKYREPHQVKILDRPDFLKLIQASPWDSIEVNYDDRYQYAVCRKGEALPSKCDGSAA